MSASIRSLQSDASNRYDFWTPRTVCQKIGCFIIKHYTIFNSNNSSSSFPALGLLRNAISIIKQNTFFISKVFLKSKQQDISYTLPTRMSASSSCGTPWFKWRGSDIRIKGSKCFTSAGTLRLSRILQVTTLPVDSHPLARNTLVGLLFVFKVLCTLYCTEIVLYQYRKCWKGFNINVIKKLLNIFSVLTNFLSG
jgi:hypothetical protein